MKIITVWQKHRNIEPSALNPRPAIQSSTLFIAENVFGYIRRRCVGHQSGLPDFSMSLIYNSRLRFTTKFLERLWFLNSVMWLFVTTANFLLNISSTWRSIQINSISLGNWRVESEFLVWWGISVKSWNPFFLWNNEERSPFIINPISR